jgi:hypothetical protein
MGPGTGRVLQQPQPSRQTTERLQRDPLSLDERIRIRAHEIWQAHDGQGGSAKADWLQAEEEILSESEK